MRVVIVGAGVVGLSTAYWLRKAGAEVVICERGPIPNPRAASSDHHRLIRYPYGAQKGYCARMREAFAAWRAMWADMPGAPERYYTETGMLAVSQSTGDYTDVSRQVMDDLGVPYERIDGVAALEARFPFLEAANIAYGIVSEGGALMANAILVDLADWLRRDGAIISERSDVASIDPATATVTLVDGRALSGDLVIATAGVSTGALAPSVGERLRLRRTVVVYADPPSELAEVWSTAPCWTDLGGDVDLWGMPPMAGLSMKLGDGALGSFHESDDEALRVTSGEEIARMIESYKARFRNMDRYTPRFGHANFWVWAPEEAFVLERQDRALIVSACSGHGFKFGALSGHDIADAALGRAPVAVVAERMAARAVEQL